ncbi:MAG: hypothetical protein AAF721_01145 [Myxococcota bacterium]
MDWRGMAAVGIVTAIGGCTSGDDVFVDGGSTASSSSTGDSALDASSSGGSSSGSSSDGAVLDGTSSGGGSSSSGAQDGSSGDPDPFCGDGRINGIEECDDGEDNAETAACKPDCIEARCGDGLVHEGVEECDDANDINNDGCTDECIILESCGDEIVQPPEECDHGPENADNAECKTNCQFNVCGDGDVFNGTETCDDGNGENNDKCTELCEPPECGDGFVQSVIGELCDDGDVADGDECNSDCFSAGLWTVTHNAPANNNDSAFAAAIDSVNNVIVVGEVFDVVEGTNSWVRSYNGNGQINWTQTYHNVTTDRAHGVVVAPNDDIYVAGSTFTNTDGRDIWIRQFDPDGTPGPIFTENGDDDDHDEAFGIAMDPAGDLLVAGYTTTMANGRDIWVRKYTIAGGVEWTRIVSSAGTSLDEGHGVAVDTGGNVVVTGFLTVPGENRDIWVRKYDGDGGELWTDTVSGAAGSNDEGNGIATDGDDNVVVTGFINDGATGRDIWIRKYNAAGVEQWTETFNAPQDDTDAGEDVGVDTDGNIIAVGTIFRGVQQDNVWAGKYDPDGELLWTMEYNNPDAFLSDAGRGVAVDSEDNIAIVGFETRSDIMEGRNIWIRYVLQ